MKENGVCCFTGHRPMKLPFGADESHPKCNQLKIILRAEIECLITEHRVCRFITGMALGIDQICAEIVLDLKRSIPRLCWNVLFHMRGRPFSGQWNKGNATLVFLKNAMRKPCCRPDTQKTVCRNETDIWWITAIMFWLCGTVPPAAEAVRPSAMHKRWEK